MRSARPVFAVIMVLMVIGVLLTIPAWSQDATALPVFPGAEGWGTTTPGGRGGQVIYVTSLADSGPGTLREAAEATTGPRTIVFAVSGVIRLQKHINLGGRWDPKNGDNPYSFCTIAGQSAPGGGIVISGRTFMVHNGVHDVVLRNLRFRDSDEDCVQVAYGCRNIVIDHCSMSWSTDENLDVTMDTTYVTVSNCIMAEGLLHGEHVKGEGHSMGSLISRGVDRLSMHHNFFSGNFARNPLLSGGSLDKWQQFIQFPVFDLRNNLIYNYRTGTVVSTGGQVNVVGNVYVKGPSSLAHTAGVGIYQDAEDGTRLYVEDNIDPHLNAAGDPWSMVQVGEGADRYGIKPQIYQASKPFMAPAVTMVPAVDLADYLLPRVGALPHDSVDQRLIEEFRTGTGAAAAPDRYHDTPIPEPEPGVAPLDTDLDGMPDAWEAAHGLNPEDAGDCWQDADGNGYTNLEDYLNGLISCGD